MTITFTFTEIICPSCETRVGILPGHIKRQRELGEPVRCPICFWTLIKNEKEERNDDSLDNV